MSTPGHPPSLRLSLRPVLLDPVHREHDGELHWLSRMNSPHNAHSGASFRARLPGISPATTRLRLQVELMGPHFRTALITGEHGLNKEDIARALHKASPANRGAFVVCDASRLETLALPEEAGRDRDLIGSLLANVANAKGATLFVREIGRLSASAQEKLLHLLDVVEVAPKDRIRVIASLSGDARSLVAAGKLLPELEARLGVITLAVTPLRDRPDDIHGLATGLVKELAAELGTGRIAEISPAAMQELRSRRWPGNERELEAVLRLAVATSDGTTIESADLPAALRPAASGEAAEPTGDGPTRLQDVIEAHVQTVLRRCEGNKLKAAEILGISRSTLYRMLESSNSVAGRVE